jgi:hypothetical protein
MRKRKLLLIILIPLLSGCLSTLESLASGLSGENAPLSEEEVARGLKEALRKGTEYAVNELSIEDGYYGDPLLRLLLPPEADVVISHIQKIPGGEDLLNDLILRINRSAEEAASEAFPVFTSAIEEMTIVEAFEILSGKENEATDYFKIKSYEQLVSLYEPKLEKALKKDLIGGISADETWYTLQDLYNTLAKSLPGKISGMKVVEIDLSLYLTEQALDGIFIKVAQEEKAIRENPLKRVNDLLKRVFGSLD